MMPVTFARDIPNPEIALALALLVVAVLATRFRFNWLGWWERPVAVLGRKKNLAILVAGLAPLVLRAALLALFPIPEPRVHDEFTFLLGADTFLLGRLANPQHPFWMHFQSPHILSRPVYASAFPMAQSALLAIGKLLGHPWIGVYLSAGLMCAAICWMLQGWVPRRWALIGALLAVLKFGVSSYWMNSYWGGCVAAVGGALVLGAVPRIIRGANWQRAVPLGIGLAILANSRPFEGAVFGAAAIGMLAAWMIARRYPFPLAMRHVAVPLMIMLAITAAGMSYAFARITGNPWVMPYVLYRDSITMAPHFIWQSPRAEPMYSNRELRTFYIISEMADYRMARSFRGLRARVATYWRFYIGPILTIPFLAALLLWRNRKMRWLLLMGAIFLLALAGQVWHNPHYAAPATGLVILIVVQGLRALRVWRPPSGLTLSRCVPLACAVMLTIQVALPGRDGPHASWRWPLPGGVARARISQELMDAAQSSRQRQLVFVRYSDSHDLGDEWVYNDADIDGSQIVWARELDPVSNQKLMRHFGDRQVWLIAPDAPDARLQSYADAPFRPMKFVQLDAPGIDVLQVNEVKRRVLAETPSHESARLSCDVWNYYFADATGMSPPPDASGCFPASGRSDKVTFEHWFEWLKRQK